MIGRAVVGSTPAPTLSERWGDSLPRLPHVDGTLETVAQGRYRLHLQLSVVRRETKGEPGNAAADRFAAFLTSPEAGAIMREYGASLITPAPTMTQAAAQ